MVKIQDVSSKGRSTRLKGIKTNRQHEFLLDLEGNYFYLTEYSNYIVTGRRTDFEKIEKLHMQ
ncbi:hypothetical protein QRE65_00375 (plasmid) [Bacillus cereus]|nr:hypothetical protein [Bacillus cereus]WJE23109.1 hypothetical protein QRE65_00375 [Bacillus cereus]